MTILGVLADTHVPDRVPRLDRQVFEIFKQANVQAILHAGDVSTPQVLDELRQVAPIYAVQGNRDIVSLRQLPHQIKLDFDGISIGMSHGHGTFSRYMLDKVNRAIRGRLVERYLKRMLLTFPDVDVIVFGHVHVPCNFHLEGKLIFNPGSTSYPWPRGSQPTIGLIHLEIKKEPRGEILLIK